MNKRFTTGSTGVVVIIAIVALILGVLGFFLVQRLNATPETTPAQTPSTSQTTSAKTETPKATTGTITGKAVYPSEGYPADFKVCALNASTKAEVVCDASLAGKTSASQYSIAITPGEYLVAAKAASMTGYYDKYMRDVYGTAADNNFNMCQGDYTTPLTVTVTAGKTLDSITAGNFYASC